MDHQVFADSTYTCSTCRFEAHVGVSASGVGRGDVLSSPEDAFDRAVVDAENNVAHTLAAARCPKCSARDKSAMLRWWLFYLIPSFICIAFALAVVVAPLFVELSDAEWPRVAGWAIRFFLASSVVAFVVYTLPRRWRIDGSITWFDDDD